MVQYSVLVRGGAKESKMTSEERELTEAQRILDGEQCPCGEYGPEINYEAGCVWIECKCGRSRAAPDFEISECLKLWKQHK